MASTGDDCPPMGRFDVAPYHQPAERFLDRLDRSPPPLRGTGQEVFHAHLHVIPRYADETGKGIRYWLKQDANRRR